MSKKRHKPEEIVTKLRQFEALKAELLLSIRQAQTVINKWLN